MNTSLTTFFSLLNQSGQGSKKHPFIKHTIFRCLWWKDRLRDGSMGRSTGTAKLERISRDGLQCTNRNLCITSLPLPPPSLPPCVYMWGPSRLEALPGPRCSLSTPRFQRGSRALQQQAAHTARTSKDQEPGEDNLLHINTDLPVSCLSHWFCFLAQDGLGSEKASSGEVRGVGNEPMSSSCRAVPPLACHRQEVNSYWLLNKWLQCVGVRGLFPPHSPSLDKHVLTEQLHTNPLGEILHIVPQAADKWNAYSTCEHDLLRMDTQKCICAYTQLNTTILMQT